MAFARNHGVNIVIHQLNEPRWVIYGGNYSKNGQVHELHISYHNGEHYSSVRRINDNTTEPAWVKHNETTSAVTVVSILLCAKYCLFTISFDFQTHHGQSSLVMFLATSNYTVYCRC